MASEPTKGKDAGEKDPRAEEIAAFKAKIAAMEAEIASKDAALKAAQEEIRIRPVAPGAVKGKPLAFAKCAISYNGKTVARGALLPWDPTDPPDGCGGLVEGVHYELR